MSETGGVYAEPDEMTLRDYAAVIRRRKWYVIIPTVLATLVALGLSLSQTNMYRAEAEVLVQQPPTAGAIGAVAQPMTARAIQNELQRAEGSAMEREARDVVGEEPELDVNLAVSEDSDVFVFVGESRSPERAATAADAYATAYITDRSESIQAEFEAQAEVVQGRIDALDAELFADDSALTEDQRTIALVQRNEYQSELEALETSARLAEDAGAVIINAAEVPDSPFEPTPVRTALLAFVVGLLIGLGAAFLVDYMDRSLRDEEELIKATGLPVLAVIPKLKGWKPSDTHVVTREDPSSPPAEAYRALRTGLQFLQIDRKLKVVQVTSPKPADGKTTTSANLAVVCARAGQRVALLDCDLRRPRVHEFFGLANDQGFTSVLMGASPADVVQKVDGEPNLVVIPSGPIPPDPSEVLANDKTEKLIESLADHFDVVIVDSPPVLVVSDPLILSSHADGVVLVASADSTNREQAERAAAQLAQVDAPVLGTVLNAFNPKAGHSSYDYRYAYGSYK